MNSAAADLATIGSDLSAAHTAAAAQTTGVLAAAEDEVSAAVAALFSAHGQGFQALSAQAGLFHDQFVQTLSAGAASYASTEATNVFRTVLHEIIFLQPLIQPCRPPRKPSYKLWKSNGEGLQSLGLSLQYAGEILGTSGQGLEFLGQGFQDFGQSLLTIAQDLQQLPISGGQP